MNKVQRIKKEKTFPARSLFSVFCSLLIVLCSLFFVSCSSMATSAEEYFNLGMAFYDLGKFEDAEKWLTRARQADKTYSASQYNLGRIAFERKRYDEAAKIFEGILKKDPDNIIALRAAAYTRINMGNFEKAKDHYAHLLKLVPESSDDGYNHALVLFAMEKYVEAEEILEKYPFALQDNKDVQLLYARTQGRQNKVEAIEKFSNWLSVNSDARARYEYAQILEYHEYYARALEEYRKAHTDIADNATSPSKLEVRFSIAKLLLIAESENNSGVTELQSAVEDGYNNIQSIEELLTHPRISAANKNSLRTIADNLRREELAVQERRRSEQRRLEAEQRRLEEEQRQRELEEQEAEYSETYSETYSD